MKITPEQLLAEVEDILRTMPQRNAFQGDSPEIFSWLGRAEAVVRLWDSLKAASFSASVSGLHSNMAHTSHRAYREVYTMLNLARHDLRLGTVGPLTVAVEQGAVFDYFDEIRKVIQMAKIDLLFVDPYLDAEFVKRYLPHVSQGVMVRLLAGERLPKLLPAVALFRQQNNLAIEVRSAAGLHDRYVFVDRLSCYQSGASFKDGAKKAPTTLTQIVDAFAAVLGTYEQTWANATVHP